MKNKLEQLLNTLIQRGWKPFGRNSNKAYYRPEGPDEFYFGENGYGYIYNWRQVVSKESGLWQFVCENGMVNAIGSEIEIKNLNEGYGVVRDADYQYWILISSLKDESELEDFLLSNIVIKDE